MQRQRLQFQGSIVVGAGFSEEPARATFRLKAEATAARGVEADLQVGLAVPKLIVVGAGFSRPAESPAQGEQRNARRNMEGMKKAYG